ncbi:hypothetical protein LINPERPRIM_LOCUS20750, partial [Linum perenne]
PSQFLSFSVSSPISLLLVLIIFFFSNFLVFYFSPSPFYLHSLLLVLIRRLSTDKFGRTARRKGTGRTASHDGMGWTAKRATIGRMRRRDGRKED